MALKLVDLGTDVNCKDSVGGRFYAVIGGPSTQAGRQKGRHCALYSSAVVESRSRRVCVFCCS